MSTYYTGCDTTIPEPICSDCPDKELGGIRSLILVKKTYSFSDPTDPNEWQTAIDNGDVWVFPWTRGSLEQAEQESEGFGDQEADVDGYEFTLTVMEPNYADNVNFWNQMKKSNQYKVGYRTESKVHFSDVVANFIPKAPVEEDKKSRVLWNLTIKWTQEDLPLAYNMPENVFDRCVANG